MAHEIEIRGLVQGVGFRPFVYRTANMLGIRGTVQNVGFGVRIVVHCNDKQLQKLVSYIENSSPPLSKIDSVDVKKINAKAPKGFRIIMSRSSTDVPEISPDVCVCTACVNEINNKKDRRYLHPFINCTDCGPRFTIIKDSPYDRDKTSMATFNMCSDCKKEYLDPNDRRFHAQPISCRVCGPKYKLQTFGGKTLSNPIERAAKELKNGAIIAIKGIGGYHLACNARKHNSVMRLRSGKYRENKAFAIMARDMNAAQEVARISIYEKEEMLSARRPIAILKEKKRIDGIAPGLDSVGIMLPYAPIHYLLFKFSGLKLMVMTSGNQQSEPIITKNDEAFSKLKDIADYVLLHDRDIVSNCDDSVVKFIGDRMTILRYSRGLAPGPIPINTKKSIAGVGAELNANFCVSRGGVAHLSQFMGDVDTYDSFNNFKGNFMRTLNWLRCKPEVIVSDLHPDFFTTRFAEGYDAAHVMVQHHLAHLYSVMAEHKLKKALGIILDGYGYGSDGTAWGGELMHSDGVRLGRIENFELIGGDMGARFPYRSLYSILRNQLSAEEAEKAFKKFKMPVSILGRQYERRINCVSTSSCGRVLDAASYLFEGCSERTYEGEPALRLESFASSAPTNPKPTMIDVGGVNVLEISKLFVKLLKEKNKKKGARMVHDYIAIGFAKMAEQACKKEGINDVCLSGGVMYNRYIPPTIEKYLSKKGINVYQNERVPCGDGGLSLGQVYYAAIN